MAAVISNANTKLYRNKPAAAQDNRTIRPKAYTPIGQTPASAQLIKLNIAANVIQPQAKALSHPTPVQPPTMRQQVIYRSPA